MADQLSQKHKIPVTLMEDTGVFSLMPRVSKVVIGTHTILANGGLKAIAGCHPVLLAAKYYNVPVRYSSIFYLSKETDCITHILPFPSGPGSSPPLQT